MDSLFQLALVLGIVGAIIAYIGDRLGTFVGKKRLSKFGLRPKHTAILYTTITGGIIPLLALVVFFNINSTFKTAITQEHALVARNHRLAAGNRNLEAENETLARQYADAQAQTAAANAQAVTAKAEARQKTMQLASVNAQLARDEATAVVDQKQLASAQRGLDEAMANLSTAQRDLASAKSQSKVYSAQVVADQRKVADALVKVASAQQEVGTRQRKLDQLNNEYRTLSALNDHLAQRAQDLESHDNIYRPGDEVGRAVISTNDPPDQIRGRLTSWLDTLSHDASSRHAGAGSDGRYIIVEGDGSENPNQTIPESESLDTLTDHISADAGVVSSVIVVAQARYNTLPGDQVRLDLHAYDNMLVFSKGDVVAKTMVDGDLPQKDVMEELMTFVHHQLEPIAHEKAIMPTVDPESLEKNYGEADHLLDTVAKIEADGGAAEVEAVAKDDIYTQGPLNVELQVVPPVKPAAVVETPPVAPVQSPAVPTTPASVAIPDSQPKAGHRSIPVAGLR